MIPVLLEELIVSGAATPEVVTFGGGALSSWAIPSNRVAIVWQLEIFPFADVANGAITPTLMAQRMTHYYELSDDRTRFGKIHRSTGSFVHPPPAPDGFTPSGCPVVYPVYHVFDSKLIVCRISWVPGNTRGQTNKTVPSPETSVVAGYPAAATVVESFQGWGAPAVAWVPDIRNTVVGQFVNQPRPYPTALPVASRTILELPRTTSDEYQPYSWPLMTANIVLVSKDEWERVVNKLRNKYQA